MSGTLPGTLQAVAHWLWDITRSLLDIIRWLWHAVTRWLKGPGCRLLLWAFWTVLISLLPFGGVATVQVFAKGFWSGLPSLIGSGQLLPTIVALFLGGIKELSTKSAHKYTRGRVFVGTISTIALVVAAFFYGVLLTRLSYNPLTISEMATVARTSKIAFFIAFATAAFCVILTTPEPQLQAERTVNLGD